ncbi:MAG: hypothetical protein K2P39_08510 [Lachnospiraceae bacterium]|nr:hypothetical protein [Lachnospiraceae bacterium]MDE7028507.1 hypothetical protein [Lachnospiraceae bacterium]
MRRIKSFHIVKAFKIALAAVLSILTANLLGLKYAVTAGIITVLSIQNTKRETLKTARNRGLAFLCALALAFLCYALVGFGVGAFILYLFLFALLCLSAGWGEAIAMDSVLISHFLTEQSFGRQMIANELLLFLIGTFYGILINLHLRKKEGEFDALSRQVDEEIKGIVHRMGENLMRADKTGYNSDCFARLEDRIRLAKESALRNWNNTLWSQSAYELDYIRMRENQSRVLRNIYDSIVRIDMLPAQTMQVAAFFCEIEKQYHRDNDVEGLLKILEKMLFNMKLEALPQSREEFEARALLFYTLMQLDEFLRLKNRFVVRYGATGRNPK